MFFQIKDPVYINKNAYLKGAKAFEREEENVLSEFDPQVKFDLVGEETFLEINLPEEIFEIETEIFSTHKLGMLRVVEAPFDDPNGNPIEFDKDYFGNQRDKNAVGPFNDLKPGLNRIKVW